jgi:hypothetical protein
VGATPNLSGNRAGYCIGTRDASEAFRLVAEGLTTIPLWMLDSGRRMGPLYRGRTWFIDARRSRTPGYLSGKLQGATAA